jgi:integrase
VPPVSFSSFRNEILDCYRPPLRAAATHRRMGQVLDLVGRLDPPPSSTADLTVGLIARYVRVRADVVCNNALAGELSYLAAACSFAVAEGWLERSPFHSRRFRLRPEPPAAKQHHSLDELRRVLGWLRDRAGLSWRDHRLYVAASLVAYTGLRRNEALYLRVEDLDLAAGILAVVARRRLKTLASAQPVPIPPELGEVLAGWLPVCDSEWVMPCSHRRTPWVGGNVSSRACDQLAAAGRAVGVEGLTFLSLRHSWATHAETAWGLSEAAIQRVLRHTRPLTQRLYRHADLANLRAIAGQVTIPICRPGD